jgi:hypothetical protein
VVLLGERITVAAIVGLSQTIGGAKITLRRDGAVPEPPRSERKTRDATPIVRGTDAVEAIALL